MVGDEAAALKWTNAAVRDLCVPHSMSEALLATVTASAITLPTIYLLKHIPLESST